MTKSTLLLSTAVGLTIAVAGPAMAAKHELPNGVKSHVTLPGAKSTGLTHGVTPSRGGQLSEAWATTTIFTSAGGFTPYDSVSGSCRGRTGHTCTIEVENLLQVYSFSSFKEGVAIETDVNGYFTNGSGYWQYQDSGDVFVNQAFRSNITVNPGTFTGTDYVFSSASLEIGHRQSDYTVWKN